MLSDLMGRPRVEVFTDDVRKRKSDPVEVMTDLREGIEALPETVATFRMSRVLDDHDGTQVAPEMVTMAGSWKVPGVFTSAKWNGAHYYVNPRNPHSRQYTDVFVECECGAVMAMQERHLGNTLSGEEQGHTDECRKSWRFRARADLLDRRAEIIEETLKLGLPAARAAERLALSRKRAGKSIGHISEPMRLPTKEWKALGKERRMNTETILLAKGYTGAQVGKLWGITGGAVHARVKRKTDWTITELQETA